MKAFDFIRSLWIGVQLSAPPFVQRLVIPRLHAAKELVRLLARPYLPYHQLAGQGQGGPLTVTFIGLEYAWPRLETLLFVDKPEKQNSGRIPFWRLGDLAEGFSTDTVIVGAAEQLVRRLPRRHAIVLPEFIHHIVDVRGDWENVRSRFRKNARDYLLRLVRKYGYEYQVSHAHEDFKEFYYQMYLPTMHARHGELASPVPVHEAYQYFRHGWLFKVTRGGTWVSGVICEPQQHTLNYRTVGVRNGDPELIRQGATSSTYYAAIHWANQHGYEAVNFLGTAPYMRLGLFQHKRRWGAKLSIPSYLHRQIWIKVQHNTPAVARFLKENPCITVDKDGKLHGLIVVDDLNDVPAETRAEWQDLYVTPGLSSLVISTLDHFTPRISGDGNEDLIIPLTDDSALVNES